MTDTPPFGDSGQAISTVLLATSTMTESLTGASVVDVVCSHRVEERVEGAGRLVVIGELVDEVSTAMASRLMARSCWP